MAKKRIEITLFLEHSLDKPHGHCPIEKPLQISDQPIEGNLDFEGITKESTEINDPLRPIYTKHKFKLVNNGQ